MSRTRRLATIAVLAAAIAVVAPFTIPTVPVPFSLSVLAVAFAAAMLPPGQALACLSVYLLLGFAGLPVFSNFRGGPGVLLGPTGGYLVGYFALVLGISMAVKYTQRLPLQGLGGVLGLLVFYLFGSLWYMLVAGVSFLEAVALCVAPFLLFDLAKIAIALLLARAVKRRLPQGGKKTG